MAKIIAKHWDIFEEPPEDTSTVDWNYVEVRDRQTTGSTIDSKISTFTFEMNDLDAYVMPSKSYVFVKAIVTQGDGTTAFGSEIAIQNGAPLWSRGEYLVNGKQIELVDNLHYAHLVKNLLQYSDDYKRGGGTDQGWYPDTGAGGTGVTPYSTVSNLTALTLTDGTPNTLNASTIVSTTTSGADLNLGYAVRSELLSSGGKVITLKIPLSRLFGFCTIDKVSIGVRHSIKLTKNIMTDIFHTNTALTNSSNTATLVYKDIAIWMPYVKPSLTASIMLERSLSSGGQANLAFERINVRDKEIIDEQNPIWDIQTETERINKVVCFLMPSTELGKQTKNSARFHALKMEQAYIKIGSFKYPDQDFQFSLEDPVVANNDAQYHRIYNEYLRVSDKILDYDSGVPVSYTDFRTLYPMICFDLRHQSENLFSAGNPVEMRLHLRLGGKPGFNYRIFACIFSDREVQLDVVNRKMFYAVQ